MNDSPLSPLYLNLTCCQCGKSYQHPDYFRGVYLGEPLYWVIYEDNKVHLSNPEYEKNRGRNIIHFCGPSCSNDFFLKTCNK